MFESKAALFEPRQTRLAEVARALGHPARIAILEILAARDTCICGDLVDVLPLAQASVSRHLKTLKEAGLIRGEVDGPRSCYCLDRPAIEALRRDAGGLFDRLLDAPGADCC